MQIRPQPQSTMQIRLQQQSTIQIQPDADSAAAAGDDTDWAAAAVLASCCSRTSSKVGNRRPPPCIALTKELATDAKKCGVFVCDFFTLDLACGNRPVRIMIVTVLLPKPGTTKQSSSHGR